MCELVSVMREGGEIDVSKYKKRRRSRSLVKNKYRCSAKRADGMQCSRQRKDGELYCGTHIKGCPHGQYEIKKDEKEELKLTIREYKGIAYYIDFEKGDVYSSEDIKNGDVPRVIGKYKDGEVKIKKSQ